MEIFTIFEVLGGFLGGLRIGYVVGVFRKEVWQDEGGQVSSEEQ